MINLKYKSGFPYFSLYGDEIRDLLGVFISCLFSGSLSTFDSAIHSMAVVTVEELLTIKRFRFMSEKQKTTVTKYICVFYGMAAMSTALALPSLSMFLTVAGTFLGATLGPMFAYIVVSVTMPFVNLKGSMVGLCSGLVINIWLSAGSTTERLTFPRLPLSMDNCSLRLVIFISTKQFNILNQPQLCWMTRA